MPEHPPAILHLYWFPLDGFAPSMREHIDSFEKHSRWPVLSWNTAYGFPMEIEGLRFSCVLLHYSLFGGPIYWLNDAWLEYIEQQNAVIAAFFQDEYRFWGIREKLLRRLQIDVVFSCFDEKYFPETYGKCDWNGRFEQTLTGYVGEDLRQQAERFSKPRSERSIDVGYRARRLQECMGQGAAEKHRIAEGFLEHSCEYDAALSLDLSVNEEDRLYGEDWYAFLGDSRAVLGVEAGVSIVDRNDLLWAAWRRFKSEFPEASWEETEEALGLSAWENNIPLRTISPRHFEAAAFCCAQVLFEGDYNGILVPMRHYIPLMKDFSNFEDVLKLLRDEEFCRSMTLCAQKEIIDSGRWDYAGFIAQFDRILEECGVPGPDHSKRAEEELSQWKGRLRDALSRAESEIKHGASWFGPHCYPRPHWPANLRHLAEADWRDILRETA